MKLTPAIIARIWLSVLLLSPLALIAIGAWMIYPPAAFLSVGGLLWLDFTKKASAK